MGLRQHNMPIAETKPQAQPAAVKDNREKLDIGEVIAPQVQLRRGRLRGGYLLNHILSSEVS